MVHKKNLPWDGPTYCGSNKEDITNCECVKIKDSYSQCQLKKNNYSLNF